MPPTGPLLKKKSANANPLRRPVPVKRVASASSGSGASRSAPAPSITNARGPNVLGAGGTAASHKSDGNSNAANFKDYKLRSCTAEEVSGLRHHIMKFHGKAKDDLVKSFTQPVRLHRKDPRNMQNQLTLAELQERRNRTLGNGVPGESFGSDTPMSDGDSVKAEPGLPGLPGLEQTAEEKDEKSKKDDKGKAPTEQVDLSLIAPDGGARRAKVNPFQKKTRQVILGDENARKLRYEEHYPWVIEDFDGKNTWVGNYEAGQADSYVLFMFDNDGFKMIPAEKYYKMTPRNKYQTLTAEEAEKRMQKGEQSNRWVMKYFPGENGETTSRPVNMRRRFKTTDREIAEEDSIRRPEEQEELDYDEEFADDEEAPMMDGNEEDVKEVEKKIKKELRGDATDALFEEEEEEDKSKIDKNGMKLIKSLITLENNVNYDSDEDVNPYASEDETTDEEETAPTTQESTTVIKQEPDSKPAAVNVTETASPTLEVKKDKKLKKDKKDKKKKKSYNFEIDSKTGKKVFTNLPPGMVVLQLAPKVLSSFPPNVWNPDLKRRRVDKDEPKKVKKIKVKSEQNVSTAPPAPINTGSRQGSPEASISRLGSPVSPVPAAVAPAAPAAAAPASNESEILTEDDVISVIKAGNVTTKQLLNALKPKMKKHPGNNQLLKKFVPKVAKLVDGVLVLKE